MILRYLIFSFIKEAQQSLRKHDFDLNTPKIDDSSIHNKFQPPNRHRQIEIFECKRCGHKISLERWQMKSLPFGMAHGCRGFKIR